MCRESIVPFVFVCHCWPQVQNRTFHMCNRPTFEPQHSTSHCTYVIQPCAERATIRLVKLLVALFQERLHTALSKPLYQRCIEIQAIIDETSLKVRVEWWWWDPCSDCQRIEKLVLIQAKCRFVCCWRLLNFGFLFVTGTAFCVASSTGEHIWVQQSTWMGHRPCILVLLSGASKS